MSPAQYAALKLELLNDPKALGYAANIAAGNDDANATLLNATTGAGTAPVFRHDVTPEQVVNAIAAADFAAATALQVAKLNLLFQAGLIDTRLPNVRASLQGIFNGAATVAALTALVSRTGSRAEVLFSNGMQVTYRDIAIALRG